MRGYYAPSGNYITVAEIKRRRSKRKKEKQELKKKKAIKEQQEQKRRSLLYTAEKKEQQAEQKRREELIKEKSNFLNSIGKYELPYRQFLIIWDLLHCNHYQIEADYKKGRITKNDINKVLKIIPEKLLTDFQKEFLISISNKKETGLNDYKI